MPLNAEQVWWGSAWSGGLYTATWTVDFAPHAVMAKVWPTFYMEYDEDDVSMVHAFITQVRERLPDGGGQTVSVGKVPTAWADHMTSVTFGLTLYNCQA